MNFFTLI